MATHVDPEILIASAHTHSLSMALLTLAFGMLALATRWPRGLVGALFALSAFGLVCDLGSWFLAREAVAFVWLVAGGGALWMWDTASSSRHHAAPTTSTTLSTMPTS